MRELNAKIYYIFVQQVISNAQTIIPQKLNRAPPFPMIPNRAVAFLAAIVFSGCASCPVQTFDKVTPANETDGVRAYTDGPKHVVLKVGADVTIDVNSCWETGLCANINLPEGRRLQFSTDDFAELNGESGNVVQIHKANRINYVVTCEENKTTPRICSSSELSPTSGSIEVTAVSDSSHNDWKWQFYKKAFSPTLEFVGASETKGSLLRSLFSYNGQREYQLPIFMEHKAGTKPYIVRFPIVLIDGKSFKLPDIRVERVNEPLCSYRAW